MAVFVAVAAFLWSKEVDDTCVAPYDDTVPTTLVNVHDRFRDLLKIWWTVALVDFFRSIFAIASVAAKKSDYSKTSLIFAWIYQILVINDIFLIGAILILHAYRFQYSGKWCSGDYLDIQSQSKTGYLIARGNLFVGLVIYVWVGLLTYSCLMSCLITAASRRFSSSSSEVKAVSQTEDIEKIIKSDKPYDHEIQTTILACSAAQLGQVQILKKLAESGVYMAGGDYDLRTPLHIAAAAGQLESAKFLLEIDEVLENINSEDRWRATPLDDVKASDVQIKDLLEKYGAQKSGNKQKYKPMRPLNLNDDNYRLFYAAYHNDVATMELLSKFDDFKVNAYDYDGRTALHIAASECNNEAIIFLLEKRANPLQKDSRGNTPVDDAERYPEDSDAHLHKKTTSISTLRNADKGYRTGN